MLQFCEVWHFDKDGQMVSGNGYYDQYTLLTQLGHIQPLAAAAWQLAKLTHRKGAGGRLYRFDIRNPSTPCVDVPNAICSLKPSRATVFFRLCAQCSSKHSLKFTFHDGVKVEP